MSYFLSLAGFKLKYRYLTKVVMTMYMLYRVMLYYQRMQPRVKPYALFVIRQSQTVTACRLVLTVSNVYRVTYSRGFSRIE